MPLPKPEADGTLTWDEVTVVVAEPEVGGLRGVGFTFGTRACAPFMRDKLERVIAGRDAMDVPGMWATMFPSRR